MNCLELFSGTHSFKKVADKLGYKTVSLDIRNYKGIEPPTHQIDILDWDYKQYPKDYFDIIWASPPCIYYSKLQNSWLGRYKINKKTGEKYLFTREILNEKLKIADKWLKKTKEIIDYFKPKKFFIENPATAITNKRGILDDYKNYVVDYCKYSDWGYRKRTRIWTNVNFNPKPLCKKDCNNMHENGSKHKLRNMGSNGGTTILKESYRVPELLIKNLLSSN
jgi:site-specific DNA-cytosine methylase